VSWLWLTSRAGNSQNYHKSRRRKLWYHDCVYRPEYECMQHFVCKNFRLVYTMVILGVPSDLGMFFSGRSDGLYRIAQQRFGRVIVLPLAKFIFGTHRFVAIETGARRPCTSCSVMWLRNTVNLLFLIPVTNSCSNVQRCVSLLTVNITVNF
jgi:hypothetical protein